MIEGSGFIYLTNGFGDSDPGAQKHMDPTDPDPQYLLLIPIFPDRVLLK